MKPTDFDIHFDAEILGGLPVIVAANIVAPEPEINYPGGVEAVTVFTTGGKPAPWAEARLTDADWMKLEDQADAEVHAQAEADHYDRGDFELRDREGW